MKEQNVLKILLLLIHVLYCLVRPQVSSFGFPHSSLLRKKIDESVQVLPTPLKLSFFHFLSLFPELVRFSICLPLLAKLSSITIFLYNILNSAASPCIILIILNSAVSPWLSLVSAGVFSYKLADTN
jgi:hypothetical protein